MSLNSFVSLLYDALSFTSRYVQMRILCFISYDGAHPVVTYRNLFPVSRERGDMKAELMSFVKNRLGFQECEKTMEKCLKDAVRVFYNIF